ncbi:MAG: GNAT family N-acetyltransferase [Actinobacteria bacterium]|nr:GNAT family N-acetyltransferase [Actinomycetota bacterium]MCA1721954.1 GNAT family N-acetyltransferase [Actinomycetota bacterium]
MQTVFGRGDAARCQCQRFKLGPFPWMPEPVEERAARLRDSLGCDDPAETRTSGLIAYLDGAPVGWCAVEPRTAYQRLLTSRSPVVWKGRDEDKADDGVWAVTCLITRQGYRRRGVSARLVAATVDFARSRGARAVEGYPMVVPAGKVVTWGELHVGSRASFEDAGFGEVSHPTLRRVVMRIDL